MGQFISIDWGTSALRCRVANTGSTMTEAEICSESGIANTFEKWSQSGKQEKERLLFYQLVLVKEIEKLEIKIGKQLKGIPVIISGMASANIGMKNLPYKSIPFSTTGNDLGVEIINATKDFNHNMLLISGIRSDCDVMRGEETQLIGSIAGNSENEDLYIFPGTHSKHIMVKNGMANEFKTYLTGEVFNLLSTKSILSKSVEKITRLSSSQDIQSFEKGVEDSLHENILNSIFQVRTNDLFQKASKSAGYCYMSGLLIGTEVKDISTDVSCTIVCDDIISDFYSIALKKIKVKNIRFVNMADAIVKGHCQLFQLHKSSLLQAS